MFRSPRTPHSWPKNMKYAWIREHRDSFPVALLYEILDVSKSGNYASIDREPSARVQRHTRIKAEVAHMHALFHGIYGSGKIAQVLPEEDELESACRNTVAAAMREMGLASKVTKGFTPTTTQVDPSRVPAPKMLDRAFTATEPNRK